MRAVMMMTMTRDLRPFIVRRPAPVPRTNVTRRPSRRRRRGRPTVMDCRLAAHVRRLTPFDPASRRRDMSPPTAARVADRGEGPDRDLVDSSLPPHFVTATIFV